MPRWSTLINKIIQKRVAVDCEWSVAVPVCTRNGKLLAHCGIAVEKEQSPRLLFHNFDPHCALFNQERVATGEKLWICREPLHVCKRLRTAFRPKAWCPS
jgi:hypothetical protein